MFLILQADPVPDREPQAQSGRLLSSTKAEGKQRGILEGCDHEAHFLQHLLQLPFLLILTDHFNQECRPYDFPYFIQTINLGSPVYVSRTEE